ncbi:hypothetical protein S245_013160 [Arachis hypogaea]
MVHKITKLTQNLYLFTFSVSVGNQTVPSLSSLSLSFPFSPFPFSVKHTDTQTKQAKHTHTLPHSLTHYLTLSLFLLSLSLPRPPPPLFHSLLPPEHDHIFNRQLHTPPFPVMNPTTQSNPSLQPNQQLHQLQHHQQQALFPPPLPPAPPLHQQQPPQLLQPHRPSTSCDRHPQEQFTGFCPSCLCERLAVLDPNGSAASSSSSGPRRSTSSSTAAAALRAIFRPSASGSNRGNRPPPTSSTSSSFFPELRRTKSFSASKNNEGFFSGAFEPQRRSCDVRVRSTLFSLFNQDDERKIPKKEPSGEVETRNLASSSTIVQAPVTLEEESESESESASVLEEEIQEQEEENDQNEDEIRVLEGPTNAVVPNIVTEERVAVTEIVEEEPELQPEPEIVVVPEEELLKPMKEHIDLDSNAKKSSGRDFKGSFWSAASVFSKKLQKWRQKQKLKKQRCRNGALGSGTTLLPVEKPIGRQFRETQSEIADYGFGRRSCDTDPRFSLDIGRMSFEAGRVSLDDPRYSFDEPRASWDGYLIGRTFPPPRMPSMLSVVEDAPVHQVLRTDTQIPVEEPVNVMMNAIIENADQAKVPGGTLQTREYYSDSSSRRRKSLDRSSSIRKTAAAVVAEMDELKPVSGAIPVANAKVTPAVGIGGVGGGVGIGIGISGGVDLSHHGPKAVFPDRDLRDRDSNSNSLRDDHSETFELGSRDAAGINGERKGAKKSFRWSKAWNIWGLINRRGGGGNKDDDEENRYGRGNGGNGVERSFSESWQEFRGERNGDVRGVFNRNALRSNSSVSWRNAPAFGGGVGALAAMRKSDVQANGHGKKGRDEVVLERNRSARYSPNNNSIDSGLLRLYLTPMRGSRRNWPGKGRSNQAHSIARSVLGLY